METVAPPRHWSWGVDYLHPWSWHLDQHPFLRPVARPCRSGRWEEQWRVIQKWQWASKGVLLPKQAMLGGNQSVSRWRGWRWAWRLICAIEISYKVARSNGGEWKTAAKAVTHYQGRGNTVLGTEQCSLPLLGRGQHFPHDWNHLFSVRSTISVWEFKTIWPLATFYHNRYTLGLQILSSCTYVSH